MDNIRVDDSIKAVIFDWGGVLMRTVDREPRLRWDRRLMVPDGTVESIVHGTEAWEQAQRGEIGIDEYWETVRLRLGLTSTMLSELRRDFYSGDQLDENLVMLISILRTKNIRTGLLSNNSIELLDEIVSKQLDRLFDKVVISAQIGKMKPDPDIYHIVLRQLGVAYEQALFIDDAQQNIDGALVLGMSAVLFTPNLDLPTYISHWLDDKHK